MKGFLSIGSHIQLRVTSHAGQGRASGPKAAADRIASGCELASCYGTAPQGWPARGGHGLCRERTYRARTWSLWGQWGWSPPLRAARQSAGGRRSPPSWCPSTSRGGTVCLRGRGGRSEAEGRGTSFIQNSFKMERQVAQQDRDFVRPSRPDDPHGLEHKQREWGGHVGAMPHASARLSHISMGQMLPAEFCRVLPPAIRHTGPALTSAQLGPQLLGALPWAGGWPCP